MAAREAVLSQLAIAKRLNEYTHADTMTKSIESLPSDLRAIILSATVRSMETRAAARFATMGSEAMLAVYCLHPIEHDRRRDLHRSFLRFCATAPQYLLVRLPNIVSSVQPNLRSPAILESLHLHCSRGTFFEQLFEQSIWRVCHEHFLRCDAK
jgi:hypothetical protein